MSCKLYCFGSTKFDLVFTMNPIDDLTKKDISDFEDVLSEMADDNIIKIHDRSGDYNTLDDFIAGSNRDLTYEAILCEDDITAIPYSQLSKNQPVEIRLTFNYRLYENFYSDWDEYDGYEVYSIDFNKSNFIKNLENLKNKYKESNKGLYNFIVSINIDSITDEEYHFIECDELYERKNEMYSDPNYWFID